MNERVGTPQFDQTRKLGSNPNIRFLVTPERLKVELGTCVIPTKFEYFDAL